MDYVHVAVGVILAPGASSDVPTCLVARRPADVHQGGLLEFPGGKVKATESVQQALARELEEEIGIRAGPAAMTPLIRIRHDYGDKQVLLDVWWVNGFAGVPVGREGQPLHWIALDRLNPVDFPAANVPIIRALQLPTHCLISGSGNELDYPDILDHCLEQAPADSQCIFRAPELSADSYARLLPEVGTLCQEHGVALLVHGDPEWLSVWPRATGVHLPWAKAAGYRTRPVTRDYRLGVSCHSVDELKHAAAIGADYALLSPVRATPSHPQAQPLGWRTFSDWTDQAVIPVYALGGLSLSDLLRARQSGAQGVAGIGLWWQPGPTYETGEDG